MERIRGGALAVAVLAVLLVLAPGAGASVVRLPGGGLAGVQFQNGVNPAFVPGLEPAGAASSGRRARDSEAGSSCASPDVCWQGGPVLHTVTPYLIFWEPSTMTKQQLIPAASINLLEQYLTDVSADSAETGDTFGVGRQYYDANGFADQGQTFNASEQAIVDTDLYPSPDTVACPQETQSEWCLTDYQIQNELRTVIADDRLPTGIGPGAPIYFVVTPSTVNICLTSSSCANGGSSSSGFCSYHSNFTTSNGGQVIYAAIPFAPELPDVGGAKGCQADGTSAPQYPNGDFADTIVDDLSHESNESITDPLPYSGWYDPTTGNEAADNCETYGDPSDPADGVDLDAYEPVLGGNATPPIDGTYGSLFDQSINGEHYYTQTFWSDGAAGCEAFVPLARVSPAFAAPSGAQVGTTVTFDPAASSAADGLSSATWSYGDGTSAFQVGSPEAATHTYTEPGSYTVTLTTVDADGDVAEVSHRIGIGLAPTASLRYAPRKPYAGGRVSFDGEVSTEPNAGARIDAYTWRFGDGATGTGARPHHVYRRPGAYEVTVGIRDTLGLAATSTAVLHVVSPGRIKAISTSHRDGGRVVVVVKVTAAGTIRIGARSVKLERAGRARFTLEPKGRAGRTRSITVKYRPRVGPKVSRRIRVRSRAIASRR